MTDNKETDIPEGFKLSQRRKQKNVDKEMFEWDATDKDRLTYQHYMIREFFHGNFNAPIEDALEQGIKVIDVGCSTGIWAMEMAQDFPSSTFIAANIVDEPLAKDLPGNCTFLRLNILEGLPFPDATFDYTFQRMMVAMYTPTEWLRVVSEMIRITKPGGYVEMIETDGVVQRPPQDFLKWNKAWETLTWSRGIDIYIVKKLHTLLEGSLSSVKNECISWPIGWYDRAGAMVGQYAKLYQLSIKPYMASLMGMTDDEYEQWAAQGTQKLRLQRSWINGYVAFGKKPKVYEYR
ncbi:S-adenosyl-L-methionine-dependent methyltransferase [Endogone sp. FLAS-F59071]|nr:S-adenosyl-L-methionine-dependent methyltransferase [Endogone sp. FLAS-F59071]|eukprot:RUS23234.1 S-adenosyl-L-methionine-dependent methyltransferase [Endogone sp. FLAS-F59071]